MTSNSVTSWERDSESVRQKTKGQHDALPTPYTRLAQRISQGLAPVRSCRRSDGGGRRHTEGDGLLHDCRLAGTGRSVYGIPPDGDLRDPRIVALLEREHDNDDCHPFRRSAGTSGAW